MSTRQIILESFDGEIKNIFKEKLEVQNYLLNHERKNLCIDNILSEITKIELTKAYNLKKEDVQFVGKQYAKTFASAALKLQEQKALTELQRDMLNRKNEEQKEVMSMFESEDKSQSLE